MSMPRFTTACILGALLAMNTTSAEDRPQTTRARVTLVNPDDLYDPAPYGYSHAVVAAGGSRLAFIAGQGGEVKDGEMAADFAGQVRQAYANLRAALAAVGAKPDQVVKITTYVVDYDPELLDGMTRAVRQTFGDDLPAQTLVPVPRLALDGMLFEVDAVAVLD